MDEVNFEPQDNIVSGIDIYNDLMTFYSNPDKSIYKGISTGFDNYDKITGGFQNGELVIIGARPGMGKTALLLSVILNNNCFNDIESVYFSLDTKPERIIRRLIGMLSGISINKLQTGELSHWELETLNESTKLLNQTKLIFATPDTFSIDRIVSNCERLVNEQKAKIIVIDYLQLIRYYKKGINREAEIAHICRALKHAAVKLNVPIICLSQLSRAVESRGGYRKPQLSDLRESGAIEQDSDKVIFLYRPEYYGFTEDEYGNPTNGHAELIVAKNKEGALFNVNLRFESNIVTFKNLEDKKFTFDDIRKEEFGNDAPF